MITKAKYFLFALCVICGFTACSDDEAEQAASLTVSQTELSFTGFQGTQAVKVDATRRWTAVPSDWWITVSPDNYPSDGQHFIVNAAISVADNDTEADRTGTVSFYLGDERVALVNISQAKQDESDRPDEEFPITWANLQWAAATAIAEGTEFEAGCCVFANGITNAMESTTGEDITCDIGYCTEDSRPDGNDWKWFSCWFNGDWGDNFYYQGRITEELPAGTYYYTFRVRNGSGPYKYAGTNGLWDGVDNVSGTFEVKAKSSGEHDYTGLEITWANLQWNAGTTIDAGQQFEAGSQVYIDGLTNLDDTSVDGEGVIGEIGFGISANPTSDDWTWTEGWFNGDWGNNFYYQGKTPEISTPGTYYYTFRFKMGEKGEWVYAGTDGLWDGTANTCGQFTVKSETEGPDLSGFIIKWANIQWWASEEISVGEQFEAGSKVLIEGLTDAVDSSNGEGVLCEIGYSSDNTDPSGDGWAWTDCWFNGDWGNEFYYQGKTPEMTTAGTYYYTFRYRLGKNAAYVYVGSNGLWDGTDNVARSFIVK